MPSYKIVYSKSLMGGQTEETFTIADPVDSLGAELAVRAYVEQRCKVYGVTAKVYPAAVEPLMTVGKNADIQQEPVGSKLFDGYTVLKDAGYKCCGGKKCQSDPLVPTRGKFNTPGSTWIDHVSWEKKNSSLCVHFLRGGFIVYKSDCLTFDNFLLWVGAGGSAGEYYNANIKGLPVIKRS